VLFTALSCDYTVALIADELKVQLQVDNASQQDRLGEFFLNLCTAWNGTQWTAWEGAKHWRAHEGQLSLEATTNKQGHVFVTVTLEFGPPGWRASVDLQLDAGSLHSIADAFEEFSRSLAATA